MGEIDVPTFFICPISLEIMKDPVTVSTGITYDRESIERWIFSNKSHACPVSKLPLSSDASDLIPNHTLRRLIQSWCIINAANGVERIPTPKPPVDKAHIARLVEEARKGTTTQSLMSSLHKFKTIGMESERNKRCMEAAGVAYFLASIIKKSYKSMQDESIEAADEAIIVLSSMQVTEEGLRDLIANDPEFVITLTKVLRMGNYQTRAYATILLKSIFEVLDPVQLIGMKAEIFVDVVHMLRDPISNQATKAALQILIELCPWGRNRVKAAEADAVSVLVELILEVSEKRVCEMALVVLDHLCGCAEGRAELLHHAAGLAVVSKKILRVSSVATERAVRILSSVTRFSATAAVLHEMLQVGVVSKLCLVLQVDCSNKAKQKAKEILVLHSRTWKNSHCVPLHLLASYPIPH